MPCDVATISSPVKQPLLPQASPEPRRGLGKVPSWTHTRLWPTWLVTLYVQVEWLFRPLLALLRNSRRCTRYSRPRERLLARRRNNRWNQKVHVACLYTRDTAIHRKPIACSEWATTTNLAYQRATSFLVWVARMSHLRCPIPYQVFISGPHRERIRFGRGLRVDSGK
jgi:hypothetical protein